MRIEPEISGVTVVLLGDFNPAIFTPAWFALHGLLPESVVEDADLQIAHPHVTQFAADWLRLHVTAARFLVETLQSPHVRLRDLVARTFKEYLHHTPVRAFGINRDVHFRVKSFAERDRIGRILAPVKPWGTWGHALGLDGENNGMRSLTMSQMDPGGRPSGGKINITIQPSNKIDKARPGVYVGVNDHYAIEDSELETAKHLMDLFDGNFETSLQRSDGIIDHIMSLAEKEEK